MDKQKQLELIRKELELIRKYENEILELIDNLNEYTRGDLQGRLTAIFMNIINEVKSLKQ